MCNLCRNQGNLKGGWLMEDQSNLDLRLLRVWMKASKAVVENIRKDIESHKINNENFIILDLSFISNDEKEQLIILLKRIGMGAQNLEK
jgi:MarR family transcriptional regulator, 2-MHQ and catechol-resistance regulon repressor